METFERGGKRVTLIDLSDTLDNSTSDFEPNRHHITYIDHKEGMEMTTTVFPTAEPFLSRLFPEGHAWAVEMVHLSSHSGTHVDAPYHYGPTSGGKPARTIDQVPLRWCFGDGVLLDMTHKQPGDGITAQDIETKLTEIGYDLKPYDIVLVRTDTSRYFKEKGYDMRHAGLTRDGTEYLVDRGVKLIGIDAWGLDRPFDVMFREAAQGVTGRFWESHFLGKEKEYCQIEKLANLDQLPRPYGFTVMAFPYKIKGASAGWARVVAMIEEELD